AGDPYPRADFFENDVARHLEQAIAPEERGGPQRIDRRGEAEVRVHGQRGKADVDAVEIADEIRYEQQRQESNIDLTNGRLFEVTDHDHPPPRVVWFWCGQQNAPPFLPTPLAAAPSHTADRKSSRSHL